MSVAQKYFHQHLVVLSAVIISLAAFARVADAQSLTCPQLTVTLTTNSRGTQVTQLQTYLKATGDFTGSGADITGFFGTITEDAVKRYQCRLGIVCNGNRFTTGYGAVGPATRQAIASCRGLPTLPATTPLPTITLSPTSIYQGQSAQLLWGGLYATSCNLSGGGVATTSLNGSLTVNPVATTAYTLVCKNAPVGYSPAYATTTKTLTVSTQTTPAPSTTSSQAPTARISVSPSLQVGTSFSVDGSWSTGTNVHGEAGDTFGIAHYRWDLGDGRIVEGPLHTMLEHTYTTAGSRTIVLAVTDYTGATATTTTQVSVGNLPTITVSGTTTQHILNAVAGLNGAPGIVKIPAGTYRIDKLIELPAGTIFEGAGADKTFFKNAATGTYHIRPKYGAAGNNVKISGIEFSPITTDKVDTFNLVAGGGTKNLFLKNVTMRTFQNPALISGSSAHVLGAYMYSNGRPGYGGAIMLAAETGSAYAKIISSYFSNNLHSIAANGASGSLPRNVGYDSLNNRFTKDIWVANDSHPGAAGRIRIEGNTFTGGNAIALQNGWGHVKGNTIVSTQAGGYAFKLGPLHNNNVAIPDAGVRKMAIERNTFQNTPAFVWLLGGRENVTLNCRDISSTMPDIVSSSQTLPPIQEMTWNDCQ